MKDAKRKIDTLTDRYSATHSLGDFPVILPTHLKPPVLDTGPEKRRSLKASSRSSQAAMKTVQTSKKIKVTKLEDMEDYATEAERNSLRENTSMTDLLKKRLGNSRHLDVQTIQKLRVMMNKYEL